MCWNVLECTGMYWNVLECTGMYWNVLECTGMYWNVLEWKMYWKMYWNFRKFLYIYFSYKMMISGVLCARKPNILDRQQNFLSPLTFCRIT